MSPKAREAPEESSGTQTMYRVILKPPEGHPTTFKGTQIEVDENGNDVPVEIDREYLMDLSVPAKSEQAARFHAERHAFNLAVQEAGSEDPDEVLAKQWVVESVEEVKPAEE